MAQNQPQKGSRNSRLVRSSRLTNRRNYRRLPCPNVFSKYGGGMSAGEVIQQAAQELQPTAAAAAASKAISVWVPEPMAGSWARSTF